MNTAKILKFYHLVMMTIWALIAIPGLLWWRDSLVFVIVMSLWANFAGEFAAYQGARNEDKDGK